MASFEIEESDLHQEQFKSVSSNQTTAASYISISSISLAQNLSSNTTEPAAKLIHSKFPASRTTRNPFFMSQAPVHSPRTQMCEQKVTTSWLHCRLRRPQLGKGHQTVHLIVPCPQKGVRCVIPHKAERLITDNNCPYCVSQPLASCIVMLDSGSQCRSGNNHENVEEGRLVNPGLPIQPNQNSTL